ncbi:MAG: hypothetical protein U0903_22500 [Planctomycetales bacterium]
MQSTVWKLASLTVVVAVGLIGVFQAQKLFPPLANKDTAVAKDTTVATDAKGATPPVADQEEPPADPFPSPAENSPPRTLKAVADKRGRSAEHAPIKDVVGDDNPFADEAPAKIIPSGHQKKEEIPSLADEDADDSTAKKNEVADSGPALIPSEESPAHKPKELSKRKPELAAKKQAATEEETAADPEPVYNPFAGTGKKEKKSQASADLKNEPPEEKSTDDISASQPDIQPDIQADDADFPDAVSPEKLLKKGKQKEASGPSLTTAASPTAADETPESQQPAEEQPDAEPSGKNPPRFLSKDKHGKSPYVGLERTRTPAESEPVAITPESPDTPDPLPEMSREKQPSEPAAVPASLPSGTESPAPVAAKSGSKSEKGKRPQLTIDKQAPETATLGQKMVYTILVKNVSDLPAHQVVVQDEIPVGLELDGTIPRAELSGRKLIWRIGLLNPGEERLIKARVTPMQEGDLGSVATVNFLAEPPKQPTITSGAAVRPARNVPESVLELDVDQPREVPPGTPFKIKFKITNVGKVKVTNIALRGILHPLIKHQEIAERELDCPIADLNPGQSFSVDLDLVALRAGTSFNKIQLLVNQQRVRETELEIRVSPGK